MRRWWISWWGERGTFKLTLPWWSPDVRDDDHEDSFYAAVIADDEAAARKVITDAHVDSDVDLRWRFCEPRSEAWHPFTERFPKADWMEWPGR